MVADTELENLCRWMLAKDEQTWLSSGPRSSTLSQCTPTSTLSMSYGSTWRSGFCRTRCRYWIGPVPGLPAYTYHGATTSAACALELPQNLPPDSLPSHKIPMTLANGRLSEMSLCDGPIFTVCLKPDQRLVATNIHSHVKLQKQKYPVSYSEWICNGKRETRSTVREQQREAELEMPLWCRV